MHSSTQSDLSTCTIGLDVGGTKIAAGVVTFPSGQVLIKQVIPTRPQRGGEIVLADALELVRTLLIEASQKELQVLGIGVGVAELVDLAGNVTSAQTLAWRDLPVQDSFSRLAPAVVESDVRVAGLAEAMFGAGQTFKHFVYVTVGTGISYSLVQDGKPYAGAHGNALVLASGPLTMKCTECGARIKVVLEEIASGPALVARYNQALNLANVESKMNSPSQLPGQLVRGEEVLAEASTGHPLATHVVKTAGEALGVGVGWLVNVLDPEAVIVGGGLGLAGGLYWDSFLASTREHIWAEAARDLPILPAALGVDAGLIGGAARVIRRQGSEESKGP